MNSHILFGFVVIICQLFLLACAKEIIKEVKSEIYFKGANLTSPTELHHVGTLNITGNQKNIQINGELAPLKSGIHEIKLYKVAKIEDCSGTELKNFTDINVPVKSAKVECNENYSFDEIVGKMIVIFGDKNELYNVAKDKRPTTTDKVIIACGLIEQVKSTTEAPPKPTTHATTEKPTSSSMLSQAQGLISLMSIALCFLLNKF